MKSKHIKKKANPTTKKKKLLSLKDKIAPKNTKVRIVGIGASAGGLEAIEQFFLHLGFNTGLAFVIVTHLHRNYDSYMPELIRQFTDMPVFLIENNTVVKPNTIYVIPPGKKLSIQKGKFTLGNESDPHFANLPINYFLTSLAEEAGKDAIAVILSGAGTDGSQGVQAIKEKGGLVLVQEPSTAKYDSMPNSAIESSNVDEVLSPEKIAERIQKESHLSDIFEQSSTEFQEILALLRSKTGHDFSAYKLNTIFRRIAKQMSLNHHNSLREYLLALQKHPQKIDTLFKDLLIGVTSFFRDDKAFEALKSEALPLLIKNKPKNYCLRVWIPACSTGEEVYSIAILIHECMEEINHSIDLQIFGTDIDLAALEVARSGTYHKSVLNHVSSERLRKFFIKEGNNYKVKKEIRNNVVFGAQNIIKDPPFTKVDLICCRNLLIYLNSALQKKVLDLFHYSLKQEGILFLGVSEAIGDFTDYFQLLVKKWKIFKKKNVPNNNKFLMHFPITLPSHKAILPQEGNLNEVKTKFDNINAIKELLLKQFAVPYVVIDKKGKILHLQGKTEPYLLPIKNASNLNIFEIAHKDIKVTLMSAVHKAILQNREINFKKLRVRHRSNLLTLNIKVIPFKSDHTDLIILVIFEETQELRPLSKSLSKKFSPRKMSKKIDYLEKELQFTTENLQTTIEELESSNEELQSTNEELQSTNEEIETSKEELQSLNEELVIVNTELQNRIDQLATVNDDMNNLFNSAEIAAFFLDNNLRIKRFTPRASEFIHLIQTDIGRPITDFATNLNYDRLIEDAKEVLTTLTKKTIEVTGKNNKWYIMRVLPYRTITNMIDGVILTFSEITEQKETSIKLEELNITLQDTITYIENILDTLREPLVVLDTELKILKANRFFYKTFQIIPQEVINKFIYNVLNKQFDIPELRNLLDEIIKTNTSFEGFEINFKFSNLQCNKLILNARRISHKKPSEEKILLVMELK